VASNDPFVALSECHFLNPQTMAEIRYYRNTSRWWASVDGVMRAWAGRDLTSEDSSWPHPIASELIKHMDEAAVDVCFALREGMMDISGQTVALSTNGFMMQQIEPYPDRMYLEAMVGPILRRGVDEAIWELEYLVKECNAKLCKVYQPEDLAALDDKRMWPFYEKACELDISLQPKLLRVLETHEVQRVGGTRMIPVDVRVVSATNRGSGSNRAQQEPI